MVSAGLGDNALVESKRWVEQRSLSVLIHSEASNRRRLSDFALKSSTEAEATLVFVDDYALLNQATTRSGCDVAPFSAELIRPRSARLATNSANIQHAPIAVRLYTAAPQVA